MTPQRRTLVRARDLGAFRAAIATLALEGPPLARRRRAVLVPTHASAELLRRTLEGHDLGPSGRGGLLLPDLLTREDWLAQLAGTLSGSPRVATRLEREVLLERAARKTADRPRLGGSPFRLRPGLIAEMLDLYDELGRRQRTIRRFTRVLFDQLRGERGMDRGSESLIQQTAFLAFTFLDYERGLSQSGAIDEHVMRGRLVREQPSLPVDHVIIAVADHPSDPRGLWPADFDLAGRLRTLTRIDVVMTDDTHDAGFRERLERELPGIDERRVEHPGTASRLVIPGGDPDRRVFVSRDREEELRQVTRAVRARTAATDHALTEPTAVVFYRPLPYLYLARQVLTDARVPYQAFDAQPLAGEPYAALLDLVLTVARTGGTRESAVALLRSATIGLDVDGQALAAADVAALDVALSERRATGEADSYASEVAAYFQERPHRGRVSRDAAARGARAAAAVREALAAFRTGDRASAQVRALAAFLRRHERPAASDGDMHDRQHRARAAVLAVLDELASAFERHDDAARPHAAITAAIHHAIEAQTFTPTRGAGGVHLVDAVAARFGEFDHVHVVGLVETDWPERPRRSIFYTSGLLKALGWPQEPDQMRAQQAAFRDLAIARRPDDDACTRFSSRATPSSGCRRWSRLARDLPAVAAPSRPCRAMFADEILTARRGSSVRPRSRHRRLADAPPPAARFGRCPATAGSSEPRPPERVSRQPRRSLRGLSLQVFRRERARPSRRAGRDRGPDARSSAATWCTSCSSGSMRTGTTRPWRDHRRDAA